MVHYHGENKSRKDVQDTLRNYFKITGDKPEIHKNITKIKRNKAKGPDDMFIEMVQVLGQSGTKRLTEIAMMIYDTGKIPEELLKSVFIALLTKTQMLSDVT